VGLIIGFLGLGIAAYRMSVESETPPPPTKKGVADVISDTTANKLTGKESVPKNTWTPSRKMGLASSICGFISVALGCASWLLGEHRRWTWAALCVGMAALAWTHVVVAVALAAGAAVFLWILGSLS
jgi:hypothetical protein